MAKDTAQIPDFDDILFEKRNKEYGAYQLRKRYNSVMCIGILISVFISCCAVLIPFLSKPEEKVYSIGYRSTTVDMEDLTFPEEIVVPTVPPPHASSEKVIENVPYIAPTVVDTVVPLKATLATMDEALAQNDNDNKSVDVNGFGEELVPGTGSGGSDEPLFFADEMPMFKGGDINNFRQWIQKRVFYSQEAQDKNIYGTVTLTFIIETDGSVSNVTVIKGVDPLLDNEAVKAIKSSPKWRPGMQRGQPVKIRYIFPLNFYPAR